MYTIFQITVNKCYNWDKGCEALLSIIKEIQADNFTHFDSLQKQFLPLILSWVHKTKAHPNDREDYISQAKIILLESAKSYDFRRNVPFASYYKINLYHWYGNQMTKKKWPVLSYEHLEDESTETDFDMELLNREKIEEIKKLSPCLTLHEQYILEGMLRNKAAKDIAKEMGLSKKTVLNKKYIMIKKIRNELDP